jgi:putative methylase
MELTKNGLAIILSKLSGFETPSFGLEQYATPSDIAAELLYRVAPYINGSIVDLGCGTGMLGLGALLLGAEKVIGVDVDEKALEVCKSNHKWLVDNEFDVGKMILQCGDVETVAIKPCDVVLMNPPFGTKRKHIDRIFLETAISIAPVIFSMHKTSTFEYIAKWMEKQGYGLKWSQKIRFPIKATMSHHKKLRDFAEVTLCHFERV